MRAEAIMSGELSMPRILACGYRLEKKETPLPEGGTFCSVELRGFEPLTLSMPWRCATSCAIAPNSIIGCFLSRLIIYLKSV